MLGRIALLMLTASLALPLVAQDATALTGTDPNDVPTGSADILSTTKRAYSTASGVRMISFTVEFEEPTGDAFSVIGVYIDSRLGGRGDYTIGVDVTPGTVGYVCSVYIARGRYRRCHLKTTPSVDPEDATWWRVPIRRSWLHVTKKVRWAVVSDSDFGTYDRAPDTGVYG